MIASWSADDDRLRSLNGTEGTQARYLGARDGETEPVSRHTMVRITSITLIILVSGTLIDGALAFGFALNAELLVGCTALGVIHHWLRSKCIRRSGCGPAARGRRWLVPSAALIMTALVTLVAPATVVRLLAGGQDNGGWLYVTAQLTSGGPVWSGYGGPMTLVLSVFTGLSRVIAVLTGGALESMLVPLLAVALATALTVVVVLLLVIRTFGDFGGSYRTAATTLILAVYAAAFLDFGHLSALLVFLVVAGVIVVYPAAVPDEQNALIWVAVLAMGLWLPLRPLLILGIPIALLHSWSLRRDSLATKGLLVIDGVALVPPVVLSLRSLLVHVEATPTFAVSLPAVSLSGLVDGAANLLARSGGTHSLPLWAASSVLLLLLGGARRSVSARTPVFGLVVLLLVWAFSLRLVDQAANGGSAYGSQKLLLLVSPIALLWLFRSTASGRLLFATALTVGVAPIAWSIADEHLSVDSQPLTASNDTWIDRLENDIRQPVGTFAVGCVTDLTWEVFDNPVPDDINVSSAYTCTRFLGSLAAGNDLPNDLLEFNVGEVSWREAVQRLPRSPIQLRHVMVLDGDRTAYRTTRLLDFAAESAGIRELELRLSGEAPDLSSQTSAPHSIDVINYEEGVITGWVGPQVASIVVVSEGTHPQVRASIPLAPRPDVEELLGPRGLASGFSVSIGKALPLDSCVYFISRDGESFPANGPYSC